MKISSLFCNALLGIILLTGIAAPVWAGYKAKPWDVRPRNSYVASLTSEGVTIAVEPLYVDALAAQVFDKNDIVTRGIVPIAIAIFNDNDFSVEVDGSSIELISGNDHLHTLSPNEVVYRVFKKDSSWIRQSIPRIPRSELNTDALDDFDSKFLMAKVIGPHEKGGGFLYLHIPEKDPILFLLDSRIYIPNVYRKDTGARMIFFEIDVGPALKGK
jgi:hypothetical protein